MVKLALIGKNIQHSKSKEIYEKLLNTSIDYTLLDFENPEQIPPAVELLKKFTGISITSPYKQYFLEQLDHNFSMVNGVNALRIRNKKIEGTNTDYIAVENILLSLVNRFKFQKVIVLGDGVMGTLTLKVLTQNNINFEQYSRKLNGLDKLKDEFEVSTLVINTCSREYIYSGIINNKLTFWDMNYNLDHHSQLFEKSTAHYIDGIELLELQAKNALSFWNLNTN